MRRDEGIGGWDTVWDAVRDGGRVAEDPTLILAMAGTGMMKEEGRNKV